MKMNNKGEAVLVLIAIGMIWGFMATRIFTTLNP